MTAGTATESQEQEVVIAWAKMREPRYPALRWLFAVPNGGKRHIGTAVRLKREGVKPGVPDLILPCPRGGWAGLAIEMKIRGGDVRDNQQEWLDALTGEGWLAAVCWSAGEAIELLERYVQGWRAAK